MIQRPGARPLPRSPPGIWGGDSARLNGERGGGACRPPAASGRRCARALPPARTRPAGPAPSRRPAIGAGGPHGVSGGRPRPSAGTAWRCWAGGGAGEGARPPLPAPRGHQPARPARLCGENAAAALAPWPESLLKAKLVHQRNAGKQPSARPFGFVSTLSLTVPPPAWTLPPAPP